MAKTENVHGSLSSLPCSYEQYCLDFGKEPTTGGRGAFAANLKTIMAHNSQYPAPSWRMGVNQFTDLSPAEFKSFLGNAGPRASMAYKNQ